MAEGRKIMVIDDDENIGNMLKEFLEQKDFEVTYKDSIENVGTDILGENLPDLIFLDYRMRPLTGKDLLERIHRENEYIPIVMMSAYKTVDGFFEMKNMGAYDYIAKPFNFDEIDSILKKVFSL